MSKAIHETYRAQMEGKDYRSDVALFLSTLCLIVGISLTLVYALGLYWNDPRPTLLEPGVLIIVASAVVIKLILRKQGEGWG